MGWATPSTNLGCDLSHKQYDFVRVQSRERERTGKTSDEYWVPTGRSDELPKVVGVPFHQLFVSVGGKEFVNHKDCHVRLATAGLHERTRDRVEQLIAQLVEFLVLQATGENQF